MRNPPLNVVLDAILDAPVKDERALMEFPFFSLTKQPRMIPFVYDDGVVRIEVQPGHKGIATVWDKDVLIYCASLINERIERGMKVQPELRFAAYDFLKLTQRSTSARGYELFLEALDRLQSTAVKTTITSGHEDIQERRAFSWIDKYRVLMRRTRTGKQVMEAVEVTMNDWLWRALVENRRVLTISPDYFKLEMGLERRLYELARKHCGRQREWRIGLARLAEKCGSARGLKQFKAEVGKIIARSSLPEYDLALEPGTVRESLAGTNVRFAPKPETALPLDPSDEPASPHAAPTLALQARTIERARRDYSGHDVDALIRAWQTWTLRQGEEIRDSDRAFLAFARRYVSNRQLRQTASGSRPVDFREDMSRVAALGSAQGGLLSQHVVG